MIAPLVRAELICFYSRVDVNEPSTYAEASIRIVKADERKVDLKELVKALELYPIILKLKTLDALHALSAFKLGAKRFVTLDNEISKRKKVVEETFRSGSGKSSRSSSTTSQIPFSPRSRHFHLTSPSTPHSSLFHFRSNLRFPERPNHL